MLVRVTARALLGVLFMLVVLPAGAKREGRKVDLNKWPDGPVRYITRKQEVRDFRGLRTDEERALFIEKFWARRDPSGETLTNEYRQMFWLRVNEANTNFIESSKPGWMTDRGKVHILYGPPTEVQSDIDLDHAALPAAGGRGVIRWIYEGRPGRRMDVDPITVVPFARDASGEYRLSHDPKLASVFWDANAIREQSFSEKMMERLLDTGRAGTSQLSVMLDLGKMQEVPPYEQVLIETVETAEAYRAEPLDVTIDRYFHPDRAEPLVAFTVDLEGTSPDARPAVIARITPLDATRRTRVLGEGSFRLASHGGHRLAQARLVLDPGEYTVTVLVADSVALSTGLYKGRLKIPDDAGRMRHSDVVWAADLETLGYASQASYDEPFIVGGFRVVPRFDDVFHPGDTLRLFFEVYDAEPPLNVTYQIEGQDHDGSWIALGGPHVDERAGSAQGWEFSTDGRWPLGDYRVRVEVVDQQGRLVSALVDFRLESP